MLWLTAVSQDADLAICCWWPATKQLLLRGFRPVTVALVGRSAGANDGGGPLLSNAVLGKFCLAELSAAADRHEVGPSSASSAMSMSMQLTLHTAACSRGVVEQDIFVMEFVVRLRISCKHPPLKCGTVDTDQLAAS